MAEWKQLVLSVKKPFPDVLRAALAVRYLFGTPKPVPALKDRYLEKRLGIVVNYVCDD
ncbi:hypothetical protein [Streptomyces sp. NPDC086835]|uniref:hypothetical protein n=1 Tax=Streptomyces sp. NPDC086835 TaxID=3365761 RepID=UPI0038026B7D